MIAVTLPRFTPRFNPSFPVAPAQLPKSAWQHAVVQADLPFPTKGILLILATEWMDADGGSCFPNEQQIMEKAGVSRPCLTRHLRIAEERGFIRRWRYGRGNRNRRYNYQATLPELSLPVEEIGNEVSYPTGVIGNEVALHEALPSEDHDQERAPEPEPAPVELAAVPPVGALSMVEQEQEPQQEPPKPTPAPRPAGKAPVVPFNGKTQLPNDWQLPEDWREWAEQQRPELADRLDAISANFRDYHESKGTRSASWIAEWRRWVNRERAPKPPTSRRQDAQEPSRYPRPGMPEKPVSAAIRASWDYSEQQRVALLIREGIDPTTGLRIGPPAAPLPTGPLPLPDGSRLVSGARETPEQYARRFEEHRQFQLRRLQELIDARAKEEGNQ